MKIYHGTSPAFAERIVENGIQPRSETGNSNWEEIDMQSIRNHVYLSVPFAPYYALAASDTSEIALVEIELDELTGAELYPDEDFIEQAIRSADMQIEQPNERFKPSAEMASRTANVRNNIDAFQPYWESSLDVLGNISHRGAIPSDAVSRVVVADLPKHIRMAIDPVIEIHAAQMIRSKYETFTALLMGDEVSESEYLAAIMGIQTPDGVSTSNMIGEEEKKMLSNAGNIDVEETLDQDYVTELM